MRSGLHLTVVLILLSAAGCSGTDVLNSSGATMAVTISATNLGSEFEAAAFSVDQITLRPVDGNANSALGPIDIGVIGQPLLIDAVNLPSDGATVPVTYGAYRIQSVQMRQVILRDTDPPVGQATCEEYVNLYCTGALAIGCNGFQNTLMVMTDFGRDVIVTVGPGEEVSLELSIDVEAMAQAFVSAHVCKQAGCPGNAPWCIQRFNPGTFTAQSASFLDFD